MQTYIRDYNFAVGQTNIASSPAQKNTVEIFL